MDRKEFISELKKSVKEVKEQRLTDHYKLLNLTPEERKTLDRYDYFMQGYKIYNDFPKNFDLYELAWLLTDVINSYDGVKASTYTTASASGKFSSPQKYLWLKINFENGMKFNEMFASYYSFKKTHGKVLNPKFNTVEETEQTLTTLFDEAGIKYNNEFADRIFYLAYNSIRTKNQDFEQ